MNKIKITSMVIVMFMALFLAGPTVLGNTIELSRAPEGVTGVGTADDPYLISSKADWNAVAASISSGEGTDAHYKLTDDIGSAADPVTQSISTSSANAFKGHFDGNGKTLYVDLSGTDYVAPIVFAQDAEITKLTVAGSVKATFQYIGGIICVARGNNTISNCVVTADIDFSGDYYGGSFVGSVDQTSGGGASNVALTNCAFTGSINFGGSPNRCGGIVGGSYNYNTTASFTNVLFAPSSVTGSKKSYADTFMFTYSATPTYNGAYYTTKLGSTHSRAKQVSLTPYDTGVYKVINIAGYSCYAKASVSGVNDQYTFTGDPIDVLSAVTVKDEYSKKLTQDTDYTVVITPSEVLAYGYYSMTVTGIGDFAGTFTKDFKVEYATNYLGLDGKSTTCNEDQELLTSSTQTLGDKWYIAVKDVEINDRVTVEGNANIILCDGANLTIHKGINVKNGNSLTIWAQSKSKSCGTLVIDEVPAGYAGIGGGYWEAAGQININGGDISVNCTNEYSAGIGAGYGASDGSVITINAGTVNAVGCKAAGIGRSNADTQDDVIININGGNITASSTRGGVGIGAVNGPDSQINITYNTNSSDISVQSSSYIGKVTLGASFDGSDGSSYAAGLIEDNSKIAGINLTKHTTNHVYAAPVWTWSDDNSSATATFNCTLCTDKQTLNATVTEDPDFDAGTCNFTATVVFDEQEYTDVKENIQLDQYTVTFVNLDGSTYETLSDVYRFAKIAPPADPTGYDEYEFAGWFKNAECTEAWVFDTDKVQSDLTLYPRWTHTHGDGKVFTVWGKTNAMPSVPGNYMLLDNVDLTDTWQVRKDSEWSVCLHGKNITYTPSLVYSAIRIWYKDKLNIYDCTDDPGTIKSNGNSGGNSNPNAAIEVLNNNINAGTLNLYNGKISGSKANGVINEGYFNMYGGEISNNGKNGIDLTRGTFFMKGGTISYNSQSGINNEGTCKIAAGSIVNNKQRGVYNRSISIVELEKDSGMAGKITIKSNGWTDVYLRNGDVVSIQAKLTEDSSIGLCILHTNTPSLTSVEGTQLTNGFEGKAKLDNFFLRFDQGDDKLLYNYDVYNGEIRLRNIAKVELDPGDGTGDKIQQTVFYGDAFELPECTFTAPVGKKFDHWEVIPRMDVYYPGQSEVITFDHTDTFAYTAIYVDIPPIDVTLDFGEGHDSFVNTYYGSGSTYTVSGSKVTFSVLSGTTLEEFFEKSLVIDPLMRQKKDDSNYMFSGKFGLKKLSDYASKTEYDEETADRANIVLTKDTTLYAFWYAPISAVTVTVEAPACGTEVIYDDQVYPYPYQSVTPSATVTAGASIEVTSWLDDSSPNYYFSGTLTGGNTYDAEIAFVADFGYYFDGNVSDIVTVSGATYKDGDLAISGSVLINGKLNVDVTHSEGKAVRENEVAPKCTDDGSYDEVTYCTGCKAEISRVTKSIPALGHDYSKVEYTWSSDNSSVTARSVCGRDSIHVEEQTVKTTSKITKAPTETEEGIRTYTSAAFANKIFTVQTKEVPIPKLTPKPTVTAKPTAKPTATATPTQKAKPSAKPTATATPTKKAEPSSKPTEPTKPATPTATAKPTATATPTKKAEPTKKPADKVKLTLNLTKTNADCGKSVTIKATLTGSSDKVKWKSSNRKIATVDANGKVTGKMAGSVTITATAAGKSATCTVQVLYKDVTNSKDFWYKPTYYLTDKDVVKGYDKQTKFKPTNVCTRAQMVTFIWRLVGEPAPRAKTCKFSDVKEKDYFYKACMWGNENHIVEGYKDGTFGPQIVCARRHAVTFLWRLAGKPNPKNSKNKFSDVKKSDYFYTATLWASEKKILAGYADGTFRPNGDCMRRQMVTFLYKYDKYINKKG